MALPTPPAPKTSAVFAFHAPSGILGGRDGRFQLSMAAWQSVLKPSRFFAVEDDWCWAAPMRGRPRPSR